MYMEIWPALPQRTGVLPGAGVRGGGTLCLEGHVFFGWQIPLRIRGKPRTLAPEKSAHDCQHSPTTLGPSQSPAEHKDHCWLWKEFPNLNSLSWGGVARRLLLKKKFKSAAMGCRFRDLFRAWTKLGHRGQSQNSVPLPLPPCIVFQIPW